MASLTGQTVSSTYDGLLKTEDNDILGASGKLITDGLGNSSGLTLSTTGDVSISGDLTVDGAILDSNGYAGDNGQILSSTGAGTDWIDLSEISGVDGSGTANYIPKWTDGDTIGNSVIYDDGTNVGIGTATPSSTLNIVHTDPIPFRIARSTAGQTAIRLTNGSANNVDLTNDGSDGFSIANGGAIRMRIISTGDISFRDTSANEAFYWDASAASLGLGVSNPGAKLEIENGQEGLYLVVGGDDAGNARALRFTSSTSSSSSIGALHTIKANSVGGEIAFANGNGNIMYLDVNGYAGIGTDNPERRLHINSGSTNAVALFESTDSNAQIYIKDNSGEMSIQKVSTDVLFVTENSTTHGNLRFLSNSSTERMRITSSGNVGIGTSSPSYSLDIRGAVNIQNTITSQLFLQSNSGAYFASINVGGTGNGLGYTTGQLYFENSNNSITFNTKTGAGESMRIDSSGNINIYDGIISGTAYSTSAVVSASTIDFTAAQVFTKTMTGNTTFSITNAQIGMVKDLYLTGDYTFSITNGKLIAGTYDGTVTNFIQIVAQTTTSFWYSISQEQA